MRYLYASSILNARWLCFLQNIRCTIEVIGNRCEDVEVSRLLRLHSTGFVTALMLDRWHTVRFQTLNPW
eukprot:jgi/Botrbrau1/13099/Bobra.0187s0057.1